MLCQSDGTGPSPAALFTTGGSHHATFCCLSCLKIRPTSDMTRGKAFSPPPPKRQQQQQQRRRQQKITANRLRQKPPQWRSRLQLALPGRSGVSGGEALPGYTLIPCDHRRHSRLLGLIPPTWQCGVCVCDWCGSLDVKSCPSSCLNTHSS